MESLATRLYAGFPNKCTGYLLGHSEGTCDDIQGHENNGIAETGVHPAPLTACGRLRGTRTGQLQHTQGLLPAPASVKYPAALRRPRNAHPDAPVQAEV
jgi:hypothetical protein